MGPESKQRKGYEMEENPPEIHSATFHTHSPTFHTHIRKLLFSENRVQILVR